MCRAYPYLNYIGLPHFLKSTIPVTRPWWRHTPVATVLQGDPKIETHEHINIFSPNQAYGLHLCREDSMHEHLE